MKNQTLNLSTFILWETKNGDIKKTTITSKATVNTIYSIESNFTTSIFHIYKSLHQVDLSL